tara:strand:+ start:91 stop:318 length:228 start_codon:yes stop_codon:yes gene_type:complete
MKTKHLDNEIERLNLMERTKDLSEYGQDMLNEFRAIKQALTIPVVIVSDFCSCDGVQDLHAMTGECRKCGKECDY